jgi:hypothetical protein
MPTNDHNPLVISTILCYFYSSRERLNVWQAKTLSFSNMMTHIFVLDGWVYSCLTKSICGLNLVVALEKVFVA